MNELIGTKDKIIKASKELFAAKGFSGTSIRDIAKLADVNLGAINYHFKSKELLYVHVFQTSYQWVEEAIKMISSKEDLDTKGFALKVFDFFTENKSALMNTFKIILDESIQIPEDAIESESTLLGPPGGDILETKIKKDLSLDLDEASIQWAVKVIFSTITYWSIISSSPILQSKCKGDPFFETKTQKESLKRLIDSLFMSLRANQ